MTRFHLICALAAGTFVTAPAIAQHDQHSDHQHGTQSSAPQRATDDHRATETHRQSDPYPLTTCPVSGEKLGEMGEPVVREYDGREVRFCCKMCVSKFEASKDEYWKKIDAQIVKDQLAFYPLTTCVISDEPLTEDGEDISVNFVYENRLVRFCCRKCVNTFLKDPDAVLTKLDAAVIQQQRKNYPLQTCLVSGEKLGSMGDPYEVVIDNHLVRMCCQGCEAELRANPLTYLTTLDEAWKKQGLPTPTASVDDEAHAEHGDDSAHGHDGHQH